MARCSFTPAPALCANRPKKLEAVNPPTPTANAKFATRHANCPIKCSHGRSPGNGCLFLTFHTREGTRGHGKGRKAERAVPLVMKRNCVTVRSIQLSNPFSELYICFPLSGTRALRTRAFFPLMGDTQHNGTVTSLSHRTPSRQQ